MKHLLATISLLGLLGIGPAMAADGINSTGGELPIGAGGQTVARVFDNGYVKFYDPTTKIETAWVNAIDGTASFGTNAGRTNLNGNQLWTNQGTLYLNHSNLSPVNINQSLNINGNQIWTNNSDLYFNYSTANDSNVIVGNTSKITNFQILNGSLNVGGAWINSAQLSKLVNMVNVFDSCGDGQTVVKSGNSYTCFSVNDSVPPGTVCGLSVGNQGWGGNASCKGMDPLYDGCPTGYSQRQWAVGKIGNGIMAFCVKN